MESDAASLDFEWHPGKAASNLRRHGVAFSQAATVFLDPLARSVPDEEHSVAEDRWVTMGMAEDGRLLVVVHTVRQKDGQALVRIITARVATRRERQTYES